MRGQYLVLGVLLLLSLSGDAQVGTFEKVRGAVLKGDSQQALQELHTPQAEKMEPAEKSLGAFLEGVLLSDKQDYVGAKAALEKSLGLSAGIDAYAYFNLAQIHIREGQFKKARLALDRADRSEPTSEMKMDIHFLLSEINMQERDYGSATQHLHYLERKWRRSDEYPQVLWRLIQVELKRDRRSEACRWAKKLYISHPEHPLAYDWGIDLQNAVVDGKKLGCVVYHKDQLKRIRKMQWAGESERARRELDALRGRTPKSASGEVDGLLANFLVNDGFVEEALKILLPHYDKQKSNLNYLQLLARAAARAGEYPAAVGAFYRMHQLSPRSRLGREALFQSASLSYQVQDYDGALTKFDRFIDQYPRSGLSRDAQWHMAWIRYLKADYKGALKQFQLVKMERKRMGRRRYRTQINERVAYWMAMSQLRLKQFAEARQSFEELIVGEALGFYARAAQARLKTLPEVAAPVRTPASAELVGAKEAVSQAEAPSPNAEGATPPPSAVNEANESEESLAAKEESAAPDGTDEDETEDGDAAEEGSDAAQTEAGLGEPEQGDEEMELWRSTSFKDPRLRKRFETARDLMAVGLNNLARLELTEIERRTRNPGYLKLLMSAYQGIEAYNRSSYIGEIYFGGQRAQGLDEARFLWEYAYPTAYKSNVEKQARNLGIPADWIWGIMRSESHYKPDIISPVGARGLMQLMPETARQVARLSGDTGFVVQNLNDPEVNIRLGSRYLQRLAQRFNNQLHLIAAGYNAGPHRVENWVAGFGTLDTDEFIEHIPFLETRNYVKKVIKNYGIYQNLYRKSPDNLFWLKDPIRFKLSGRPSTREIWE